MNLSPDWVPFDAAGIDAVHWSTVGAPNAPDTAVMSWARANGCAVFTNDLDFSALLAMTRDSGPSVLQLRVQDLLPAAVGGTVRYVVRQYESALSKGAIITVAEKGARIRILPLTAEPA